jgi:hypothetical protein
MTITVCAKCHKPSGESDLVFLPEQSRELRCVCLDCATAIVGPEKAKAQLMSRLKIEATSEGIMLRREIEQ